MGSGRSRGLKRRVAALFSFEALPFYLFFTLAVVATLGNAAPGVSDPDYFWHLATGRYIAASGSIPGQDPFSYSRAGAEWVLEEWPFQILIYQVQRLLGHTGALALSAAAIAASLWITYRSARLFLRNAFPALLLTALASLPLLAFTAPRPHLTTYLLFAVFLHILLKAKYAGSHARLAWLPVIMVVWVNLHGGFMIGLALVLSFLAGEGVRWLLFHKVENGGPAFVRALALCFLASLLASVINIDGPQRLLYPLQVVGMAVNSQIAEWRPLNLNDTLPRIFAATFLLYLLALVWRRAKADLTEVALPLALSFAAFSAARHLPFAIMTLVPLTARFAADLPDHPAFEALRPRWQGLHKAAQWLQRRREANAIMDGAACGLVLAAGLVLLPVSTQRALSPETNSLVAMADYLEANPHDGRLLNSYGDGGYLVWRLFPRTRVFIDSRAGLYGDDFVMASFNAAQGGPKWRDFLERWRFDYAVLPSRLPLVQLMLETKAYREERRIGGHSLLIRDPEK